MYIAMYIGGAGMALHINNPETERLARILARLRGVGLTETVRVALSNELEREQASGRDVRSATAEELLAWTDEWRRKYGIDPAKMEPWTKEDWDELWEEGLRDSETQR